MERVAIFFEHVIVRLALVMLGIMSVLSLLIKVKFVLSGGEAGVVQVNSLLFVLGCLGILVFLFKFRHVLDHLSVKHLFICFSILYLCAGLYVIFHENGVLRADPKFVMRSAMAFNRGDYSPLNPGEYMGMYPHQLGLMTYERLILAIVPKTRALFLSQLLLVIGINFFVWQTVRVANPTNPRGEKIAVILSFLFLPQFFFILFAYGSIPGLFCLSVALFCMVKYFKERSFPWFLGNLFFLVAACVVRNNYIIAAIALMLVYLVDFLRTKQLRMLVFGCLLLVIPGISGKLIIRYYETVTNIAVNAPVPKISYLTMGLQNNPLPNEFVGWYNGYHHDLYRKLNGDVEAVEEQSREDLKKEVDALISDPSYALDFFSEKFYATWSDPSFQSIWSGPLKRHHQYVSSSILSEIYTGKGYYRWLMSYMNVITFAIFIFAFIFCLRILFKKERFNPLLLFVLLYLLGGIAFHLLWETKSQYVYPYVYLLILVASANTFRFKRKPQHKRMLNHKFK